MVINDWQLVEQGTHRSVQVGEVILDFRGDPAVLAGEARRGICLRAAGYGLATGAGSIFLRCLD